MAAHAAGSRVGRGLLVAWLQRSSALLPLTAGDASLPAPPCAPGRRRTAECACRGEGGLALLPDNRACLCCAAMKPDQAARNKRIETEHKKAATLGFTNTSSNLNGFKQT